MTLLVTSIAPNDLGTLRVSAERAWAEGAEAVEIRIDNFRDSVETVAAYLVQHSDRTWIVTCRSVIEGGKSELTPVERARLVAAATAGTNALVDFEFSDWRGSAEARAVLGGDAEANPGTSRRIVLSAHDFGGLPDELAATAAAIAADPAHAVAKVAYYPHHACDTFAALDLLHERERARRDSRTSGSRTSGGARKDSRTSDSRTSDSRTSDSRTSDSRTSGSHTSDSERSDLIAISMGEDGLWTRVLAKKLGAFASYCSLDAPDGTAPGQPTIREMRELYRWERINADTKVFGVIGDPVAHSMSPKLFNHWFAEMAIDAVYLPMLVRAKDGCIRRFLDGCRARPWLAIGGFSVTLPHKAAAVNWAGDGAEWLARRIGAANTICFDRERVRAYNTDCYAAIDSLANALGCRRTELNGLSVDILGSGGAAAALVYALPMFGCEVTVFGRSADRTRQLAEPFGAKAAAWDDRTRPRGGVLINCTNVGLWPDADASPMPPGALAGRRLVFDVIYNPLETRLLRDAAACGVPTLNGLDMFVRQAAVQFELWFGGVPDPVTAKRLLEAEISARCAQGDRSSGCGGVSSVALIGLRGSGKTTVGRELAAIMGGGCIDTDDLVVRDAGCSIAEMFVREGESGFRARENKAIAELAAHPPSVISVGGGAVLDPRNVEALRGVATVVWLTAPPDVLSQRVSNDPASASTRPRLTDLSGPDEMERMDAERRSLYERAADLTIDVTHGSPGEIAAAIAAAIRSRR